MKFSLIAISALALLQVEAIRLTAEPGVEAKPTIEVPKAEAKPAAADAKPADKDVATVNAIAADAKNDGSPAAKQTADIVAESYHPYKLPENEHSQPAMSDQVGGPIVSKEGTAIDASNPKSSFFAPGNSVTRGSSIDRSSDSP